MLTASKLTALTTLVSDAAAAAEPTLSPSALAVLLALHHHGERTATELARIAGIRQPTAVRVVDGLVSRGLVARRPGDGRRVPLALTAEGQRQAVAAQQRRLAAVDRLLAPLSSTERAALEGLLDRVLAEATTSRDGARRICRLCDHGRCHGTVCPVGSRATLLEQETR